MRLWLSAIVLSSLLCGGCRTQSGDSTQAVVLQAPAPVSERLRAEAALLAFLTSRSIREMPAHRDASVDLDNDGIADLVMLLDDQNWCDGDGCTMLVFRGGQDGFRLVSDSIATRAPIALGDRVNRGWHDLLVTVGSGDEAGTVALEFDGKRYPADPTMAAILDPSRLPSAKPMIAGDASRVASD